MTKDTKKKKKASKKLLTPLLAIRAKCLDCSNQSPGEVRVCEFKECSLYPYRSGKNPKRK